VFRIDRLGEEVQRALAHRRQFQVGEDDGRTRLPQLPDGFRLVAGLENLVPLGLERVPQHRPERVLVLDQENGK
jgi:hypothetical protein